MHIPHGLENADAGDRPPIILIPSIIDNSVIWAVHGRDLSPAFYYANQGYDVWIPNTRGTTLSLEHETLDWSTDREYWELNWLDYSIDDRDTIQYVVDNTNYDTVTLLAVNTFNTHIFLGMSDQPDFYNERVSLFVSLSPVLQYQYNSFPTFNVNCENPETIALLTEYGLPYLLPPRTTFSIGLAAQAVDVLSRLFPGFTAFFVARQGLFEDPATYDEDPFINSFSQLEWSLSTMYMNHLFQNCHAGRFQYYDYGAEENVERYGSEIPPEVPMENIDLPVALFIGPLDALGSEENIEYIVERLGDNLVFQQEYEGFGREQYMTGVDMHYLEDVVDLMEQYPPQVSASS